MRQGLFAIVLVLAAFAGGALINGPGMAWVQGRVKDLVEGGTAAPVDPSISVVEDAPEEPVSVDEPGAASSTVAAAPPTAPMAPPPPFQLDLAGNGPAEGVSADPAPPPPSVAAPRGPTLVANPSDPAPSPPISDSAPPPSPEGPTMLSEAAGADAPASPAANASDLWPDAPDSAPASAVLPTAGGGSPVDARLARTADQPAGAAGPSPSSGGDLAAWDELQRRMKELGVVRYWFEGVVGGPARYRCVVPIVGDQVVSQHFEAEGESVFAAAQAALRRVALWRAAQQP